MIYIRKSNARGRSQLTWLDSFHTFSFGEYYDESFMGFGSLRVINEDTVKPSMGFGKHPHNNMEIISYVIEGALEHQDSMGTGSVIKPGEIQRMSAGTGVEHSEFNHSKSNALHFLQIWIIPEKQGLKPSYEQITIPKENNKLILIGSRHAQNGSMTINQDIALYVAYLSPPHRIDYEIKKKRGVWIQLVKGDLILNGQSLSAGDGATVFDENMIEIEALTDSELLLFDLKIINESVD
ncbi:MAG: pirin family protein [Gammaproteobacteria bacterium]|nr:pirin family protein [Gammaproteobacteria bacterium]